MEEHKALQNKCEKDVNPILNDEDTANEVEAEIHEMECKSLQGGCKEEESEDECTSNLFVDDFHITAKVVGPCDGGETYFG